jgi:hypothetical protein
MALEGEKTEVWQRHRSSASLRFWRCEDTTQPGQFMSLAFNRQSAMPGLMFRRREPLL